MPHSPGHPCRHPFCKAIVPRGVIYCPTHAPAHKQDYARRHPEYQKMYNLKQWKVLRAMVLSRFPLCVNFQTCGRPSDTVHHRVDHENNPNLQWALDNLVGMCGPCHSKLKGWGNAKVDQHG